MYLVPIFSAPPKSPTLQQVWMFLERNGNHFFEVQDAAEATAFLEDNGMTLSSPILPVETNGVKYLFAPIDPHATADLASFYAWREITPGGGAAATPMKETWRHFLWVTDPTGEEDPWGVNRLLSDIRLGEEAEANAFRALSIWREVAVQRNAAKSS